MDLSGITPLVLTYNEAANIGRTLAALAWARRVVIVDSGSTDQTIEIVRRFPNAVLFHRSFDSHAGQWNFGLAETAIDTEWVLALDADYQAGGDFVDELKQLVPEAQTGAYEASFVYCVDGVELRASLYPPVRVLFRRGQARYVQDGHTQRLVHAGTATPLRARLRHDDRKPLQHWLVAQARYMRLEADKLRRASWRSLDWIDRLRRLRLVAPPLVFLYCLLGKGLALDGRAGLFYSLQRMTSELILSLTLLRDDLTGRGRGR